MSLTKHATKSEGTEIVGLKSGLYWHSNFLYHSGVLCLPFLQVTGLTDFVPS